jgi:L-2-hydroxyglutarate oxidase
MISRDDAGFHVECGPNAVLAFKREGYNRTSLNARDLAETLTYPAFWKMSAKYWRTGMGEMWRSLSKGAFVKALQRLLPEICAEHLQPAPAGVRAQAVSPDGTMLDDFAIAEGERVVNVLNAPSPAATASLAIGEHIVSRVAKRF